MKKIIKTVIFILGLMLLIISLDPIFKAKWTNTSFPTTKTIDGFYEEEKNSIDIIYLGSSHMMSGISPIEIWDKTGLTGYTLGSTKLSIPASYAYLMETIKKQNPKLLVMDASRIFQAYDNVDYEEDTRRSLDYLHFSLEKMEVADVLSENDSDQNLLSYMVPLFRYHGRWTDLSEEDFLYPFSNKEMFSKGQSIRFDRSKFALPDYFMNEITEEDGLSIDALSLEYFDKIVNICRENDIQILMVKIPSYTWNLYKHNMAQDIFDAYQIDFIDYCMPEESKRIDFVDTMDFADEGDHLNSFGAQKVSDDLADYIKNNYQFSANEFVEKNISDNWKKCRKQYLLQMENSKLSTCKDFIDYLELINNENYIVSIACRFDAAYCMTDSVITKLRELGLEANIKNKYKASYVALINGENVIDEGISLTSAINLNYNIDGVNFQLYSAGSEVGNSSSIKINGVEYSDGQTGLTFVVYDKRCGEVVDSHRFNTHSKYYTYGTQLKDEGVLRNFLEYVRESGNYIAVVTSKSDISEADKYDINQWLQEYGMEISNSENTFGFIFDGNDITVLEDSEIINIEYVIEGTEIRVNSSNEDKNQYAHIYIDGINKSKNSRGINIVIVDKRTKTCVCSKNF